jgi:hypothetical protein
LTRRVRVWRSRAIDGDADSLAVGLDGHLTICAVAIAVSDRCCEQSQLVGEHRSTINWRHLKQVIQCRDESPSHLG